MMQKLFSCPRVTVICMTYNHEKYVRSALDCFLDQKTSFGCKYLVHDDASTDGTVEVLKEYEKKYPDFFHMVYQRENQYSKGVSVIRNLIRNVDTDYFAICEGDDYWIDSHKLQKQFDVMEQHPELDGCAHSAEVFLNGKRDYLFAVSRKDSILPVQKLILGGVPTCSLFIRTSVFDSLPHNFYDLVPYDYTLKILSSLRGGMFYFREPMSVYRFKTENSWSMRMSRNPELYYDCLARLCRALEALNSDTCFRYKNDINYELYRTYKTMLKIRFDSSLEEEIKRIYRKLPLMYKYRNQIDFWYGVVEWRLRKYSKILGAFGMGK